MFRTERFLLKLMLDSIRSRKQGDTTFKFVSDWIQSLMGIVVTTKVLPQERRSFPSSWLLYLQLLPKWWVFLCSTRMPYMMYNISCSHLVSSLSYITLGWTFTWYGYLHWSMHGYWINRCWFPRHAWRIPPWCPRWQGPWICLFIHPLHGWIGWVVTLLLFVCVFVYTV